MVVTPRAARDLKHLPPDTHQRFLLALERLAADPSQCDVSNLQGSEVEWRLRVGDWRVRFLYGPDGTIVVLRVLPRATAYRD